MGSGRFGLAVALATPFAANGAIDLGRLTRHAQWCLANGCRRVTLFGTTGEGASVDDGEREAVWQALAEANLVGSQLVGGVAASNLGSALRQTEQAYAHGAHAVLLPPPFYFKGVDDEGLFRWFATLIERLRGQARDLLLYNIPSVTSVTLSLPLVTRLAEAFPGVVTGVKDSSGNWPYTEALLAAHAKNLEILVGDERHLASAVRAGGSGTICGMANVFPDRMTALSDQGKDDPELLGLVEEVCSLPVIAAVKSMIALGTGDQGWTRVRPPLSATPEEVTLALRDALERVRRAEAAVQAA